MTLIITYDNSSLKYTLTGDRAKFVLKVELPKLDDAAYTVRKVNGRYYCTIW